MQLRQRPLSPPQWPTNSELQAAELPDCSFFHATRERSPAAPRSLPMNVSPKWAADGETCARNDAQHDGLLRKPARDFLLERQRAASGSFGFSLAMLERAARSRSAVCRRAIMSVLTCCLGRGAKLPPEEVDGIFRRLIYARP